MKCQFFSIKKLEIKLFRILAIVLSVEILLESLSVQAKPLLKTETAPPENQPISLKEEDQLPISHKAIDLTFVRSGSDKFSVVPDNTVYINNKLFSTETSKGEASSTKSQDLTLPSLQSQSSTEDSNPGITPSLVPIDFVLFSSSENFNIIPDLFSESSLFQENFKLEEIRFSTEASEQVLKANAQYKRIPQAINKNQLPSFFTVLPLNGTLLTHLTEGEFSAGYEFGNGLSDNFIISGLYAINSQVKQSLSQDNVFVSDQTGLYLQAQTVPNNRTITITRIDPQTVNGLQFQLSFNGSCAAAGRFNFPDPNAQCSLTPGLVSDRSSIDPDTLQTTRIFETGSFGDIVSPETLAILSQPGFQSVGANGQVVGLDLLFPNTGAIDGNSLSNRSTLTRFEDLKDTYTLGVYRVRQVYKANAVKAVLGRTLHGFTGILFDRNFPVNVAAQGVAQIFPDLVPSLKGDLSVPAVTNLNQSLIFSANNTRIPERSFVVYQAGYGESKHRRKNQKKEPSATFNNIWLGLSPVTDRSFLIASRFAVTSPSRITAAVGAEGGNGSTVTPPSVLSIFNLGDTVNAISSSNLSSFYIQSYFTFFETDVNRITTSRLVEKVTYYPHISLTGNITDSDKVLRYYGGVITSPQPKAYLGLDYAQDLQKDFRFSTSIIGYINPDRDYFSKAESRIEKVFRFSPSSSLSLFGSFRYVFDQVTDSGNGLFSNPVDNFVSAGITGRIGLFSAGITQYFDILPSSVPNGTGFNLSVNLAEYGSLSGYFLPQRGVTNYGVLALLKLNPNPNAPTLSLSWNRAVFDFGADAFSNGLNATEDKFQILFRFGVPANPFIPKA